jgi:hypothetical protein
MVMLQRWNPAEEGAMRCDFAAGACHGPNCRSRLGGITVEAVLRAADTLLSRARPISAVVTAPAEAVIAAHSNGYHH